MKLSQQSVAIAIMFLSASASTTVRARAQELPTTGSIETRLGKIELQNGYPAGATAGGVTDFWQRPITDSGQTGPDKGAGCKYLILGPDDPDMKPDGYYVFRSPTVNVWSAHRALDPDPAKARALIEGLKIYPYSQRENPKPSPPC